MRGGTCHYAAHSDCNDSQEIIGVWWKLHYASACLGRLPRRYTLPNDLFLWRKELFYDVDGCLVTATEQTDGDSSSYDYTKATEQQGGFNLADRTIEPSI